MKMFKNVGYLLVYLFLSILLAGCGVVTPENPKLSPEVKDVIDLARETKSHTVNDSMLIDGVSKAKSLHDIWSLAHNTKDVSNRDSILLSGVSLAKSPKDFVFLAESAYFDKTSDTILLSGVSSCSSADDFQYLASRCKNVSNRDDILRMGTERLGSKKTLARQPTVSALVDDSPKCPANQDLQKAQAAMLKAQNAYTDAVSKGEISQKIQELNNDFQAKRKTYQDLGGL